MKCSVYCTEIATMMVKQAGSIADSQTVTVYKRFSFFFCDGFTKPWNVDQLNCRWTCIPAVHASPSHLSQRRYNYFPENWIELNYCHTLLRFMTLSKSSNMDIILMTVYTALQIFMIVNWFKKERRNLLANLLVATVLWQFWIDFIWLRLFFYVCCWCHHLYGE